MSQIERKMLFLAVILVICGVSKAAVYKVGDSKGWTSIGNVDYKSWAASKHFHVGDTIVFGYNKEFHNVVRVTHKNYNQCNATAAMGRWTSGNDSFTITRPGHYFFICSFDGHCQGGQRVDIRVLATPTPKAAPSPSPISHPPTGAAPKASGVAPSPSPTPIAVAPKASSPHVAPKSSPSPTHVPKASSPYVAPKASPTPTHAPKASSPYVAPESSRSAPTHAPKASSPFVAPKASPITTHAPKASSPYVAPKASPTATPPAPIASSPNAAPKSSVLSPADEPLPPSPAPSPTSSATPSWTTNHLFFVFAIVSIFCF